MKRRELNAPIITALLHIACPHAPSVYHNSSGLLLIDESDISNPSKFRKLKRHATQANVSGLVKVSKKWLIKHITSRYPNAYFQTGKPGVVVFEGERIAIKTFLECVKGTCVLSSTWYQSHSLRSAGLRYLNFHHLDTKPLLISMSNKTRLADSKPGIHEVDSMNELVKALDTIGEKQWFRQQMGMTRGKLSCHSCVVNKYLKFDRNMIVNETEPRHTLGTRHRKIWPRTAPTIPICNLR